MIILNNYKNKSYLILQWIEKKLFRKHVLSSKHKWSKSYSKSNKQTKNYSKHPENLYHINQPNNISINRINYYKTKY